MVECAQNENITIYSYSEIEAVTGFVGNFSVKIRRKARYVDENKCTGCGACTEKCPVKNVPDAYNLGLSNRHAAYIPFAQAIPNVAVLDATRCIKLTKGKCGLCSTVCSAGAIDYEQKETIVEEKYGAIVAATGYNPINIEGYDEFAYSQSKDVVTSLEFERILKADGPTEGHLQRLSDGKQPKTLYSYSASAAVNPVLSMAAVKNTAPRSAACIPQSTQCCAVKNIRIPMSMYSTSMFVRRVRTTMSSIAVP